MTCDIALPNKLWSEKLLKYFKFSHEICYFIFLSLLFGFSFHFENWRFHFLSIKLRWFYGTDRNIQYGCYTLINDVMCRNYGYVTMYLFCRGHNGLRIDGETKLKYCNRTELVFVISTTVNVCKYRLQLITELYLTVTDFSSHNGVTLIHGVTLLAINVSLCPTVRQTRDFIYGLKAF